MKKRLWFVYILLYKIKSANFLKCVLRFMLFTTYTFATIHKMQHEKRKPRFASIDIFHFTFPKIKRTLKKVEGNSRGKHQVFMNFQKLDDRRGYFFRKHYYSRPDQV